MTPLLISSMTAISIFMFVFFVVIIKGKSKTLKGKWLFDNFFVNLTESFIPEDRLNDVARKLSVATDKYFFNCAITRQEAQLKKVIGSPLATALGLPLATERTQKRTQELQKFQ